FIRQSLLWLSILSVAFGVIFFFAYNWQEISLLTKFALIQGLMLVSLFIYSQSTAQSHASTAILFFLALLIGSLFALFGQSYQTGKDPWQLFMLWTLFTTPLALSSKSSSLWLLWLGLANLTLSLLLDVRFGLLGLFFDNERSIILYACFNLLALVIFELLHHYQLLKNRIASQVAAVLAMIAFTWVAVFSIFEFTKNGFDLLFYLSWMSAVYYLYRIKSTDILILSSWVLSGIIFILATIGRVVDSDLNGATFLLFGLLTIGLSTAGVKWLMKLLKQSNAQGVSA
ncbi:MAG: DUF2157 domain-containing protein, partial [Alcanivoracaceae bacterium]|nr:DUF2157 domain-containing protein [Alcanivoracaceae bacterium]